ncbi:hypothetical protein [Liquorilactobacillus satsumensis]|nr:hypothetical protein [Liquorilactobacillus satsumensis]
MKEQNKKRSTSAIRESLIMLSNDKTTVKVSKNHITIQSPKLNIKQHQ